MSVQDQRVRLVVFDWAGTTVDHGCFAPVAPFMEVFAAAGIELSIEEARGPMGLHKRDHIRTLLALPRVAKAWQERNGRAASDADVDRLFADFVPRQIASVANHSRLVPGALDAFADLARRGIKIGTTTGYFRDAAELVYESARKQGYAPDVNLCVNDVPAGRPAPWMIYRIMERLDVYPGACVVKIGDTEPDIEEGRNAGAWSIGVLATGSDVGLTAEALAMLPTSEREARIDAARKKLVAAGAHCVINSVADVPNLITQIESWILRGERP